MNSKTKIYCIVVEEVSKEYEGATGLIRNKINKLCSEHGISAEEVRLYVCYATYTVWLRTKVRANLFSLYF